MKPQTRAKLQQVLNSLNGHTQATATATQAYRQSVLEAETKLKEAISAANLDEVNKKIKELQKNTDLTPLLEGLNVLSKAHEQYAEETQSQIASQIQELSDMAEKGDQELNEATDAKILNLANTITNNIEELQKNLGLTTTKITDLVKDIGDVGDRFKLYASKKSLTEFKTDFENYKVEDDKEDKQMVTDLESQIIKVRAELVKMIASKGGGSMPFQVFVGGVDPRKKWTDINLKAGSGVTIAYVDNNQTHQVDITITATGQGAGIVRSINSVSTSQTAAAASGTDYVYLCTGTMTLTLPTAVGNSNLYTVKNVGSGVITINTTSAQTIDGLSSIQMATQFTSVDLISDTANWNIT